jgi:hypothetical protein
MEFQYRKMAQEIADMALDNAKINNIPFCEWIDNVNNAYANKKMQSDFLSIQCRW